MSIFDKRVNVKPYEYPELLDYMKIIHNSFWEIEKFSYNSDVKSFKVDLNDLERDVLKKCFLALSFVESKVKVAWANIYNRMPKAEISCVGFTFAANEAVHFECYSRLLEILNLENIFSEIDSIPCMKGRSQYLTKYLEGMSSRSNKEFTKSLILFTLLVENCSLFSQFFIVSSFYKYTDRLKNFSDIISSTIGDENCHADFGSHLINIIRKENPEWFDNNMELKIRRNILKAYESECGILDWIFENGELDHISKAEVKEYLKFRFNNSLQKIGYGPEFELDQSLLNKSQYLELKSKTTSDIDFFNGISSDYEKSRSFEEESLWD